MMIPTIHLNGTSKEALMDAIQNAYSKIDDACTALCQTAPNGRDYYTQGPEALYKSQDEHFARMTKLREVMQELDELASGIDVQGRR